MRSWRMRSKAPVSEGYVIRPEQAGTTKFQGDRPTIRVREQELAQTWLEVHVVVDPDRRIEFPFRTRLSPGVTAITVPAHRVLPVSVRDPQGRPVADAIVRATYRTTASASGEDEPVGRARSVRTDARGRAHVAVPVMSSYDVVIEPPNGAPLVRRFPRGDGTAPFQVVTQPGVFVPIRVVGPGGAALAKAQVVARASMAETRITRTATTDDRGRAALGPFPEGPLEIFAKADGHAWAGRVETAVGAMGTVTLTCPIGYDLRIVVADPFGLPLEGVRAEVTAGDGGRPLVTSPLPEAWHTDAQGILHIPGLPNRTYDVTLTREGYGVEKLRGLQPGATTSFATLVRTPR